MSKVCKRKFEVGEIVYVVDCWGTSDGVQAFEACAEILKVDKENETFVAALYGDTYQKYGFKDYERLIFDSKSKAKQVAERLPKPASFVYRLIGKKVFKRKVLGVQNEYIDGVTDLVVYLDKGKYVPIGEIGKSLFLNEVDARQNKTE